MNLWRLRFKVFNDVFISYVLIFRGFAYVLYRIQHLSIETNLQPFGDGCRNVQHGISGV